MKKLTYEEITSQRIAPENIKKVERYPIYAILEGLFLGAISAIINTQYPGVAFQAVLLTIGTLFTMLFVALGVWGAMEHYQRDRKSFAYVAAVFATLSVGLVWYLNFRYGYSLAPEVTDAGLHEVLEEVRPETQVGNVAALLAGDLDEQRRVFAKYPETDGVGSSMCHPDLLEDRKLH